LRARGVGLLADLQADENERGEHRSGGRDLADEGQVFVRGDISPEAGIARNEESLSVDPFFIHSFAQACE
jgi:hypothetical protein